MKTKTIQSNFVAALGAMIALAIGFASAPSANAQVAISLSVNGFYGENYVSSGNLMPTGTKVKLGVFYNNSAFTPTADVLASWAALSEGVNSIGNMASRLETFDDTFYTLAETTTLLGDGVSAFQILYNPIAQVIADADPSAFKVQDKFSVSPAVTIPSLSNLNLGGKNAFIWIENGDRTAFGLFASNGLFPTVADSDWTLDVTSGTSDVGVLAIAGSTGLNGVTLVPEPSSFSLLATGLLALVGIRRKQRLQN